MKVLKSVENGLIRASGGTYVGGTWTPINGIGNGNPTNLAHVYPYNAMKSVVDDALKKWPDPSKTPTADNFDHDAPARLLAFLDWLFRIDDQAVVNAGFHDHPGGGQITHRGSLTC